MNSNEENNSKRNKIDDENIYEENINSENINSENLNSDEITIDKESIDVEENYKFGWGKYSEMTNGRFAMLGFLAIILIELVSKQSFLKWAGIF